MMDMLNVFRHLSYSVSYSSQDRGNLTKSMTTDVVSPNPYCTSIYSRGDDDPLVLRGLLLKHHPSELLLRSRC